MTVALFTANDGVQGDELWRTDGTAAGTYLLADIDPGSGGSNASSLVVDGGIAYFSAFDGTSNELWRSDGTVAGTYALSTAADGASPTDVTAVGSHVFYLGSDTVHGAGLFVAGGTSASPLLLGAFNGVEALTAFDGELAFSAPDGSGGVDLWITNGTSAGTRLVEDAHNAVGSTLASAGGMVFLETGGTLWSSDGTTAGTTFLGSGFGGAPTPRGFADGKLFFSAQSNLWVTDGTSAGTVELTSGDGGLQYDAAAAGGRFYFDNLMPGTQNVGLYVTDGTSAGTTLLGPISSISEITQVGQNIVFGGYESNASGLFVSNGAPSGTALVAAGAINSGSVTVADGLAYFDFTPTGGHAEVWVSDGTFAGTHLVYDPGTVGVVGSSLAGVDGEVLFGALTNGFNTEPWISDGSPAGAHEAVNVDPTTSTPVGVATASGAGATAADLGGKLVFAADLGGGVDGVYVTDGTAAGTQPLFDRPAGDSGTQVSDLTVVGSRLFFLAGTAPTPPTPPTLAQLYDNGDSGDGIIATSNNNGGIVIITGGGVVPESAGLWSSDGAAGDAVDLTPGFSAYYLTPFGGELYFGASNGSGAGLFKTDGTLAGTIRVAQVEVESQPVALNGALLFAGGEGNLYAWNGSTLTMLTSAVEVSDLTVAGGEVFFSASTPASGQELWVTDGTVAGTKVVGDIAPGAASSNPGELTAFDGGVIFTANDQTRGDQVWFSDGTAAGTYLAGDNPTVTPGQSTYTFGVTAFDGEGVFLADFNFESEELFVTNGGAQNTHPIAVLNSGGPVSAIDVLNGKLFFVDDGVGWVTDGTSAGTITLTGSYVDIGASILVNGKVYFSGYDPAVSFSISDGLYVTDGTQAGTQRLTSAEVFGMAAAGNMLFISEPGGLYAYSTLSGTTMLVSTVSGLPNDSAGAGTVAEGNTLFYLSSGALWVSDGSAVGTQMVEAAPVSGGFAGLMGAGGQLYFAGTGGGLWTSDGTAAGTSKVSTLQVTPASLTAANGELYFVATDAGHGAEVWAYDPSAKTTTLVVDAVPGATGSQPGFLTAGSGGLYFVANDAGSANELWFVNGAHTVSELTNPSRGELYEGNVGAPAMLAIGSDLFFIGTNGGGGTGLFVTDDSQVTFLASVTTDDPYSFSNVGGLLYFRGVDSSGVTQLWVSNGTAQGTFAITSAAAPNSIDASGFTVADGQVFFSGTDGVHGQELWVYGGPSGAAHMVADLNPGAGGSNPSDLTPFDGALYFVASDGVSNELWRSNGTVGDTKAITSLTDGANPEFLTADGAKLFFYGSDSTHGSGLFVTDGTGSGTTFLLAYALPSGAASGFAVSDGELYFNGPGANGAVELWKSDGTVGGTTAVGEVTVDAGSNPQTFTTLGSAVPNDFNGDGVSDFLIENTSGAVVVGEVGGGQAGYAEVAALGPEWSFRGDGDFLGEGHDQFLIENVAGAVAVGDYSGGQIHYSDVANLGPEWTFKGEGDFLGLGDDQFLIENASGAVVVGEVVGAQAAYTEVAALGPEWQFVGAGDFLGAGQSQFLIENASGAVAVGEVVSGQALYTDVAALGSEWKFVETGDFLGDGKSDFLIENTAGSVVVGEVGSSGQAAYTPVADLGPEWKFVGAGDYLGEGHDQFMIENAAGTIDIGDWLGGQVHYAQIGGLGAEWAFH